MCSSIIHIIVSCRGTARRAATWFVFSRYRCRAICQITPIYAKTIKTLHVIPANPALEVFLTLASEKKEGIVYKELVHTIIENEYIDASAEDIESFINQLIDYGFLEFSIGVSGIDPDWDHELTKQLKPLADHLPLIKDLPEYVKNNTQVG